MKQFVETNGIRLAFLDHPGPGEPLILMHGLTVNGHFFDGVIAAGLSQKRRVIAADFRGRGESDKPDSGYTIADHAQDILGLMDALGLEQAVLVGHSFGGWVTFYLSAHYPERVRQLVIVDCAAVLASQETIEAIKPSLDRLGQTIPSMEAYIAAMKQVPYYHGGFWDKHLEGFYRSDVETLDDGSVRARSKPEAIRQAMDDILATEWQTLFGQIKQPSILINAPESFGPPDAPPILTREGAMETVEAIQNCRYVAVPGNHITMFFGENAPHTIKAIIDFVEPA
jgi:pimeloyl-ACP methyl ester carboxylesterase